MATDLREVVAQNPRYRQQTTEEQEELLEACREDPLIFGKFVFGWMPAKHHAEWIEFVLYGDQPLIKNPRQLKYRQQDIFAADDCGISAPPAFAKTNWVGIVLSSWYLGKWPDRHVIYTSKTGLQAEKVSNAVRETVENNKRFQMVFPECVPNKDLGWGEKEWYLARRNTGDKDASFFAVGIGGPILNARGDLIIIDDPQDKTTSGTPFQREKAIGYIKEQVMTRKSKNGRAIFIMTRWHPDDIAGYYIKLGLRWRILPAIRCRHCLGGRCTCGKREYVSSWPSEWGLRKLLKLRSEDPAMFEKIYQGNPRSHSNALFSEKGWQYYEIKDLPDMIWEIMVFDTAQKEEESSSFSVMAHWGKVITNGIEDYYLLNLWRDRVPYDELLETAKLLYNELHPNEVFIEEKSSGVQLTQSFEAQTGIPVQRIKPQESKWERARAISNIQRTGHCHVPRDAPWVYDFIEEHVEFIGKFTDQVDTTAHALKILREVGDGSTTAETTREPVLSFKMAASGRSYLDTPDAASFDWIATRQESRWRRFSRSRPGFTADDDYSGYIGDDY